MWSPERRNVVRAALVVALVFAGGIVFGVVADRAYLVMHERIIPKGGIEFIGKHLLRRLDRSLDLSDAQEAEVRAIVNRRTQRMFEKSDELHAALHSEFIAVHTEIARILTPEQRTKFDQMQRRWHGKRLRSGPAEPIARPNSR